MVNRTLSPPSTTFETFLLDFPSKTKLLNGIPVYALPGNFDGAVRIDLHFRCGALQHTNPIVSSVTNQLITEGTNIFSAGEIAQKLDFLGAFLDKESGQDFSRITVFCLHKNMEKVLFILKDILENATFSEHELNIHKNIRLQKLKVNKEKNSWLANQKYYSALFPGEQHYGRTVGEETIQSLNRADIVDFYNKYYQPEYMHVFISGTTDSRSIDILNNTIGGKFSKKDQSITVTKEWDFMSLKSNVGRYDFPKNGSMQATIKQGKILFNRHHPDFVGMQILSTILGGYFGSRLMKNIREEKGYTYGIGSSVVSFKNTGVFTISTEVDSSMKNQTIDEIEKEIVNLQLNLVNSAELELVKNYLLGSFLRMFDGVFSKSERYNMLVLNELGKDYYLNYIKKTNSISSNDLLLLAQKHLNKDEFTTIVVG